VYSAIARTVPDFHSIFTAIARTVPDFHTEIRNITGVYLGPRQAKTSAERLAAAHWRERQQRSRKIRRRWPGRQDHKLPGPPQILQMGTILKDKMGKSLRMAQLADW
jgi:hypothetical protein